MTSLTHFLNAFRGVVVALVVLMAGASVTGAGAETVTVSSGAPEPAMLGVGELSPQLPLRGRSELGGSFDSSGSSSSSRSTAGAWRESSRRAPIGVEATKIEVDAERDDAEDDLPTDGFGLFALVVASPESDGALGPVLASPSTSALAASYCDENRPRGPPIG